MDLLSDTKVMASLQSALLFLVVANPATYRLVNGIFGFLFKVANSNTGAPTALGLVLHSVVFGLLAYVLMNIKRPVPDAILSQVRSWTGDVDAADSGVARDVVKADQEIGEAIMKKEELRSKNAKKLAKKAAKEQVASEKKNVNNAVKKMAKAAPIKALKKKEGFF